jgi:hypothetical protein
MITVSIEKVGEQIQVATEKGTLEIGSQSVKFRPKNGKTWKGPIPIEKLGGVADLFTVEDTDGENPTQ